MGVVLSVLAAIAVGGPAHADHGGRHVTGNLADQGADIFAGDNGSTHDGSSGGGTGTSTSPAGDAPQNWTQERLIPHCMQSGIGRNEDVMCMGMSQNCPEGSFRFKVYERLMSPEGRPLADWAMVGTRCEGPDTDPGVQTPTVTTQDVVDMAHAAAPVPDFVIEPAEKSYVNVPTNFAAADDQPVTVTVHPLGIAIPVTFTPTSYQWDFGDGGTGSGAGVRHASVGAPAAVEHGYRSSGSYDVSLTRVYTLAFTLPNGQSVTIPGEVSRASEPQTLEVGEIQSTVTGVG